MKDNFYIIFLFFIIATILSSCGDIQDAQSREKDNAIESKTLNGNQIRIVLKNIKDDPSKEMSYLDRCLNLFEDYERQGNDFFSIAGDDKLFYETIEYLKKRSRANIGSMRFIIKLSFILKKNIEISEYLSQTIPELALLNTENFVRIYNEFDLPHRDLIIISLENFKGPHNYRLFKRNLDEVHNELSETAREIKIKTENYLSK